MLPENRAFIVRGDDGEEYGPVGLEELRDWVAENRAGLGTEVRLDEAGAIWQPWQYYPELVALLAEADAAGALSGLSIAPLSKRMLAGITDLILGSILIFPLLFVATLAFAPEWYAHFVVALALKQYPAPQAPQEFQIIMSGFSHFGLVLFFTGFLAAHGQTPAKAILRVRVVDAYGQKPGVVRSFLRSLILVLSIFYLMGIPLTYAFFNPQRRTFHDYVAGTYVVEA